MTGCATPPRGCPTEQVRLHPLLAGYAACARETEGAVAGVEDLSQPVPVPRGEPWSPPDVETRSVRWVLLHLIEEVARHAGHET